MDNTKRILLSVLSLVVVFLCIMTVVNAVTAELDTTPPVRGLMEVHQDLVKVEYEIAEIQPICVRLDDLRIARTTLQNEAEALINGFQ